ncbi:replication initiation protein [Salmonella enterica subsp. arizonae serovar 51:g,z51:-]|nr:replication initiation protein [Salmonella enterica subsp. arizonae serovar 51:g,z51:-]
MPVQPDCCALTGHCSFEPSPEKHVKTPLVTGDSRNVRVKKLLCRLKKLA